jgi:hypothetical protein
MKNDIKKVVFKDGDRIKTAKGHTSFEGRFVVVQSKYGTIRIHKDVVVFIRDLKGDVEHDY